ncbi:methyl-accepting chemotaxis protein [Virgibacillus pantothenticus]|uniref:methyl-accepting chemotaxis protein n=1 Tax=Virgibacillus pantothenticus TaxID=1473 RepID=UPI0009857BFD|nr:methyl-accepting chemotaxis protein [Virgibacillus pantothenticus]
MKRLMRFNRVKHKLFISYIIIVFVLIVVGAYSFYNAIKAKQEVELMVNSELEAVQLAERLRANISKQDALARGYLLYEEENLRQQYEDIQTEGNELLKALQTQVASKQVTELSTTQQEWHRAVDDSFNLYESGDKKEAINMMTAEAEALGSEKIGPLVQQVLDVETKKLENEKKKIVSEAQDAQTWIIVSTVGLILLVIVIASVTVKSVCKPLERLLARMKDIAKGKVHMEPLSIHSRDEFGQMMETTNKISGNLNIILQKITVVSETVNNYGKSFSLSAKEVMEGAEQIATTMQELAAGSETQANRASDLAINMEAFTNKVSETNEQGKLIGQASQEILTMTEEGDQMMKSSSEQMSQIDHIVKDAVDKVKQLDEQSQKINLLVQAIKDIAEQTNLLSLNAAIEAARAGEHGKGFAVVADEVRKLAEQVSDSVSDITQIVTHIKQNSASVAGTLQNSYKEVEAGTSQILATQQTFSGITMFVSEMVQIINNMATHLEEMEENSSQMNEAIQDIASVTEESSAGIEQTAASAQQSSGSMGEVVDHSKELFNLGNELNEIVDQFQLK